MSMFFTTNPIITISFNGEANRSKKVVKLPSKNDTEELIIYGGQENVTGHIDVMIPPGKKIEHLGVKIEMYTTTTTINIIITKTVITYNRIGHIELYFDKGNNVKFTSLVRELECAGTMTQTKSYPFEFSTEVILSFNNINYILIIHNIETV